MYFIDARLELVLRELAHGAHHLPLLVGQFEVHRFASVPSLII